ncbi:hypothetical protein ATJ97_0055 [Georgenia soli]|uniref:Uncharacterized protein n=1 Tax=Georgenia soli TaxID=638953 RepID=A0A2A9F2B2_9MICO|nr:hypothetical protein [Georgenia soli]PFG45133.1 hypothetical protein ATJ97_0055 [Georgenia soli]
MAVYIDTEDPTSSPALECESVRAERWNGFVVPVTTARAFREFIAAWQAMDPNGTWSPTGVTVEPNTERLVYRDGDDNEDRWGLYGVTETGDGLYALDGWTWIEE